MEVGIAGAQPVANVRVVTIRGARIATSQTGRGIVWHAGAGPVTGVGIVAFGGGLVAARGTHRFGRVGAEAASANVVGAVVSVIVTRLEIFLVVGLANPQAIARIGTVTFVLVGIAAGAACRPW